MRGVPPRNCARNSLRTPQPLRPPAHAHHVTNLSLTTHHALADRGGGGKGVGGRVFANALPTELAWTTTVQRQMVCGLGGELTKEELDVVPADLRSETGQLVRQGKLEWASTVPEHPRMRRTGDPLQWETTRMAENDLVFGSRSTAFAASHPLGGEGETKVNTGVGLASPF